MADLATNIADEWVDADPEPDRQEMPPQFRLTGSGVEFREERNDSHEWVRVCSHLEVVAVTRNDNGEDWGRLLYIRDRDGTIHRWAMPMAMLAGTGEEYRRELLRLGLEIAPGTKTRNRLHIYISTCRPDESACCVARIGWHGQRFVFPEDTVGDADGEQVLLQTEGPIDHAFAEAGTLEEWQSEIADLAAGNSRLVLALSAAFAAPLLKMVNAESGGLHLRGPSSIGKTTALAVAGSVWGGGGVRGYIRQWRATDNGLEAVAQVHCDTLLCLDELSQVDGRAAGKVAYMLANGVGKNRANRAGSGRRPAEWRVLFLSTGEIGLADKVAEDGRGQKLTAGQRVRVVDLPAEAGSGLGLFEDLHGFETPEVFARHLREKAGQYYGMAAREYLQRLTEKFEAVGELIRGFTDEFVKENCATPADGQVIRVAQRFALIAAAGELAISLGILPWAVGEANQGVGICFQQWLAARGSSGPAEADAIVAQVRLFIEKHGEARFSPWEGSRDRVTPSR